MLKILWITPKWTLPLLDGARIATDSLVRSVVSTGAIVDNVCVSDSFDGIEVKDLISRWSIRDVKLVSRTKLDSLVKKLFFHFKTILKKTNLPLTFAYFHEEQTRLSVHDYIEKNDYDYIVLDALHLGTLFVDDKRYAFIRPRTKAKIILRSHNVEFELWDEARKRNHFPLSIILKWQRNKVLKLEKLITQSVDGVASISAEDKEKTINVLNPKKIECFPLGFDFSKPLSVEKIENEQFLFVGRLDWPPNKDGLEWLLREVWPQVTARRPTAKLKIVGSGDRSWLAGYSHLKNVNVVGFINNINDAYIDSAFTLVPMFYGSGTRIKVLESFVKNRPLISTRMGVQGANLLETDYINAETSQEWIDILSTIEFDQEKMRALESSRLKVEENFSEKTVGVNFIKWIQTL